MNLIENISRNIYSLEEKYITQAKQRLDRLIKPTGSLRKDGRYLYAISRNIWK